MSGSEQDGPRWDGKVEGDEVHDLVAAYLAIDIQRSPDWADDLLRRIEQAASGELDRWTRLGNAYELVLTPDGASIEEVIGTGTGVDTNVVPVPLELLARATHAWRGGFTES